MSFDYFLITEGITPDEFCEFSKAQRKCVRDNYRKFLIWEETNGECAYCAKFIPRTLLKDRRVNFSLKPDERIHKQDERSLEHILPLAEDGPRCDVDNLLPACRDCNSARYNHITPTLYAKSLKHFFYILDKEIRIHKKFERTVDQFNKTHYIKK